MPGIESSRHFYFGCVKMCMADDDASIAHITIVDNFSGKLVSIRLDVGGRASGVEIGSTLVDVYFSFQLLDAVRLFAYVHAEETLYSIRQRDGSGGGWSWERLGTDLVVEKTSQLSVGLKSQWAHWEAWNRPEFAAPSSDADTASSRPRLACTQSSAFVLRVVGGGKSSSVLECVDRDESKRAGLRVTVDAAFKKVRAGADHLLLLDTYGDAWTIGSGNHGELGRDALESDWSKMERVEALVEMGLRVVDIAAGSWHCVVLTGDGDLYGWGWNKMRQLGYSPDEVGAPSLVIATISTCPIYPCGFQFTIQPTPYPFDIDKRVVGIDAGRDWTDVQLEDCSRQHFGGENSLE